MAESVRRHRPDITVLCSPNNPTGTALDLDVVRAAIDEGDGMVIVDEAYAEFARPGTPSALSLLPQAPRLIVTRTMSKAFGMAGLRLGYLAAAKGVIDGVMLVRLPYHLSSLTQAAARAALAHRDELLSTVDAVKAQRDRIVSSVSEMGLDVSPSDANFVLFGGLDRLPAHVAGVARPRSARPRRRTAGLAAGHCGHRGGDGRVPQLRWVRSSAKEPAM